MFCVVAFMAVVPVRAKCIDFFFFLSLFFHFKWFTQFVSARVLDCNLQKMSRNLKPKREYIRRVTGTPEDWKPRVRTLAETKGVLEVSSRHSWSTAAAKITSRQPWDPMSLTSDSQLQESESDWLNLRHMPATDSGEVERANGLLWREGHMLVLILQSVGFLRDFRS